MKERLDTILVSRGYVPSREKAKELIREGKVCVGRQRVTKAGTFFETEGILLEVRDNEQKYVSRGGLKLEKAVSEWQLDLEGKVCIDIGASTGGFTDCMLQHGAAKVYAVDVGYGQMAEKLQGDMRVVSMERTNFRYLKREDMEELPDFAGADVSFISLTKILLPAWELLRESGQMVCLIKPQFEAGKGRVGKKGVVRDPGIHCEVIENVISYAKHAGFSVLHLDSSPIRGGEGNVEYLLHLQKSDSPVQTQDWSRRIEEVVQNTQIASQ